MLLKMNQSQRFLHILPNTTRRQGKEPEALTPEEVLCGGGGSGGVAGGVAPTPGGRGMSGGLALIYEVTEFLYI